jgi:hypothetical protein
MPETAQAFAAAEFRRRWEANVERGRRALADDEQAHGQNEEAVAELARCKFQRHALLREIVIRLSKENVSGAGLRDPQISELIQAAKVVARSEGIDGKG